jgi:predicted peptidase
MKQTLFFLLAIVFTLSSAAQDNPAFAKQLFIRGKDTLPLRVMYPLNYDAKKQYPLLVFLHGAGERGTNNQAQLIHGSKLFADSANRKQFPAIVVIPQCPYTDFWAQIRLVKAAHDSTPHEIDYPTDLPPGRSMALVMQLLDSLAGSGKVDNKRIYVGGLSMGGMGTFEILWRKPNFFAAAFPICGGGNVTKAADYGNNFPVWIFHGDKDPVVDVKGSRKMAAALKDAGAKVKYTEYPNVKHDSWNNAFAEPDLLPWLFSQKKQ